MYSDEPRKAAPCEQQSWKEERRRRLVDQGYRIDEKSHRAHQPHKSLDEDEKSPRVQSGTDCNAETLRPRGYVVLEDSSLEASGPRMRRSERNPFMRSLQSHSSHSRSKGDSQPGTGHRVASAVRDLLSHNNSDPRLRSDPRKRPDTPGIIRSLGEHGRHVRFVSQSNMTHLAPIREEALKHRPSQGSFPDCLVPSSESGSSNMYQQVLSEMKSLSVTESTESTLFRKRSTKTFEGVYAPVTACAPSAHDRDDRSTGYVASSSTPSSHSTNEHQIRKRERDGDKYPDDDDDDSEDDDRRRNKKGKGPEGKGSHLGLRCPFYLRDPEKYSKIQACSNGKGFADMARLRHHLKRDHTQPLRCPRCREEMKSLQDCDDHLRQTVLCDNRPQPIDDRLTAVQWDAISSRRGSMRSLQTLEEKWKALYQMIFPGESRIPSPYDKSVLLSQIEYILREVLEESMQAGPMNRYQIPIIVHNCKTRLEQPRQPAFTSSPPASTEISPGYEHSGFLVPTRTTPQITRPATAMASYPHPRPARQHNDIFAVDPVSHIDPRASHIGISMAEQQHNTNPFRASTPRLTQHQSRSPWAPLSNPSTSLLPPVRSTSTSRHRQDEIMRPWSPLNTDWVGFQLDHDGLDK